MVLIANVDIVSEVINVFLSFLGFGMVALVFYLGYLLASVIEGFVSGITGGFHLMLDKTLVNIIMKLLVAAAALFVVGPAMPAFESVVNTMIPIGDFNDISGAFADREGSFLINTVFNVVLEQIALAFAYFIPFIFVDIAVSFLESFLCDPDSEGGIVQSVLLYAVDLITLYAVNALVLNYGNFFGASMLEFLRSIDLSAGLFEFLGMLLIFILLFYFAVRDLLTSDMLITILSVNITASVMQFSVTESSRIWVLLLAVACGLVSKIIRRQFAEVDDAIFDAKFALSAAILTGVISAVIFGFVQ